MKGKMRKISSYSPSKMISIIRKVCENYATGDYTLESVCENAGVPYRTFKHWWSKYDSEGSNEGSRWSKLAEVAGLWEDAKSKNNAIAHKKLIELSETMMLKRVSGYNYEETTTKVIRKVNKNGLEVFIAVLIKKVTKHVPPSDNMIKYTLTKLCPDKYGERIEGIETAQTESRRDSRTPEEIDQEIKLIEAEIAGADD